MQLGQEAALLQGARSIGQGTFIGIAGGDEGRYWTLVSAGRESTQAT